MSNHLMLEEFEASDLKARPSQLAMIGSDEIQAKTQASYEQGYAAGWDDAIKAEAEAHERITAEFARNLQDLGFTFHEARSSMLQAFEPLLREIVQKFVPAIAAQGLLPKIMEEILPLAEVAADSMIELCVPVGKAVLVEPMLANVPSISMKIREEESLGVGQALIRMGKSERKIDLDEVTQHVIRALDDLYKSTDRSEAHG